MIDVIHKTCVYEGCTTLPNYNFKGEKRGLYCKKHKEDGMIDVIHKTCVYECCTTRPTYNFKGKKRGLYCKKHKEDGMINIVDKTCVYEGCTTLPNYNFKGEKRGLYCNLHKEDYMIDVKHKTCIEKGCKTQVLYGPLFKRRVHCAKHKKNNEFVKNNPKCDIKGCKNKPFYTRNGSNYPLSCEEHKYADDINVVEKSCVDCGLEFFIGSETGKCEYCLGHFKERVIKRGVKEKVVKDFLLENNFEFTNDKKDKESCLNYRPDFIFDFNTHIVIIEVDEKQHSGYKCECEQTRMINLSQDFGGLPVVFIRYNPDK